MSKIDKIIKELEDVLREGGRIHDEGQKKGFKLGQLAFDYEKWYTKALAAVSQIVPERVPEFVEAYRNEKRKEITYATYTISDYLTGLIVKWGGSPTFDTAQAFATKMLRQVAILNAATSAAKSVLRDIRSELRAELLDADVGGAKELAKAGHLRPAGVVSGVALEAHLASIADRRGVVLKKKNPTISDYNDALREIKAYDLPTWRLIQRLADIRNLSGHFRDREPTTDEIEDIIRGVEKVIKEVF